MMEKKEDHYYVYTRRGDAYFYERTCGSEYAARRRVEELTERPGNDQATYLLNHLIRGAFY
jgi:hypothetical protein